jgi:hypothetical protein
MAVLKLMVTLQKYIFILAFVSGNKYDINGGNVMKLSKDNALSPQIT